MRGLIHFLSYNNAVPIALGILLLGGGTVFAASNPEVIYSEVEMVVSVDNTYLVNKNLDAYSPNVSIVSVTEDPDTYFVEYVLSTIAIEDYVWQDVQKGDTLTVSKRALGEFGDLGLLVTRELQQLIEGELRLLKETQDLEKNQVTQKTVATAYSGLVGALLSDSVETIPGYTPVVTPPVNTNRANVTSASQASPASSQTSSGDAEDPHPPIIEIMGNNPAQIAVGSRYSDLGAVVTDNKDVNLRLQKFLDGVEEVSIQLDTSAPRVYEITYRAEDRAGNIAEATRIVQVGDPSEIEEEVNPDVLEEQSGGMESEVENQEGAIEPEEIDEGDLSAEEAEGETSSDEEGSPEEEEGEDNDADQATSSSQ